jgi:hypothetical protein
LLTSQAAESAFVYKVHLGDSLPSTFSSQQFEIRPAQLVKIRVRPNRALQIRAVNVGPDELAPLKSAWSTCACVIIAYSKRHPRKRALSLGPNKLRFAQVRCGEVGTTYSRLLKIGGKEDGLAKRGVIGAAF